MNDIETISKIRKMIDYAYAPFIAATANVAKGYEELFFLKGFSHYLAKPYRALEMKSLEDIFYPAKISYNLTIQINPDK